MSQIREEVSKGIVDGGLKLIGMLVLLWFGIIAVLVVFASITVHWWLVIPLVVGATMIGLALLRRRSQRRY